MPTLAEPGRQVNVVQRHILNVPIERRPGADKGDRRRSCPTLVTHK
jgi:hypothetical protein